MTAVAKRRGAKQPFWTADYNTLKATFKAALQNLGLENLGLSLHCLRHGGATHDMLSSCRSLEEIRRRGHWASFTTVKRYEKTAVVGQLLQKVEPKHLRMLLRQEGVLASSWKEIFDKLSDQGGTGQTKFASTSSRALVESQESFGDSGTRRSNGTASEAPTTTSRTLRRSARF